MKYLSINILILLFYFTTSLHGQKKFAPLNAEWKYEGHSFDCTGNHISYRVTNELMVNDKDCSTITSYHWSDENSEWIEKSELTVWESENKVYFLADTSFYLLYDFDAEIGDTILSYDPTGKELFSWTEGASNEEQPSPTPYIVEEINEIEVDGKILKSFQTYPDYNFQSDVYCVDKYEVIENIGSMSMGLTGEACFWVAKGCFGGMVCYRNEEINFDSGLLNCDSLTNIEEIKIEKNEVNIYPNPIEDELHINGLENDVIEEIRIFRINGEFYDLLDFNNRIDCTTLAKGIYIIQLIGKKSEILVSKRVIKL